MMTTIVGKLRITRIREPVDGWEFWHAYGGAVTIFDAILTSDSFEDIIESSLSGTNVLTEIDSLRTDGETRSDVVKRLIATASDVFHANRRRGK